MQRVMVNGNIIISEYCILILQKKSTVKKDI